METAARYETEVEIGRALLVPEMHANFLYDFAGDEAEASTVFTGGGAVFTNEGAEVAQESLNLGFSFTYESADGMTLFSAGYDAEIKADYDSHAGFVEAKYRF